MPKPAPKSPAAKRTGRPATPTVRRPVATGKPKPKAAGSPRPTVKVEAKPAAKPVPKATPKAPSKTAAPRTPIKAAAKAVVPPASAKMAARARPGKPMTAPRVAKATAGKPAAKPAVKPAVTSAVVGKTAATKGSVLPTRPTAAVAKAQTVRPAAVPAARPSAATRVAAAPAVPAPAATSIPPAKPKRVSSGLNARDLQHFADLLLAKRREIVGDMHSMEGEALRSGTNGLSNLPVHMADMGTDNYEQEFTLGLVERDRALLREINHALAKIPAGTYGICEGTGEAIGKPRLEFQPWARHGIEYARQRERNGRGVRMPL